MDKVELPKADNEVEVNLNGTMKKLKDFTPEDWVILDCQNYNEAVGSLNEEDNIDCPTCKNKGEIAYIENGQVYVKRCSCWNKRIIYKKMAKCGISRDMLERYSFNNFIVKNEWQKFLKERVYDYATKIKEGKKYWICLGGMSGAGKSHLCTALFKRFLENGFDSEFMLWNEEVPKILSLEKSSSEENQKNYQSRIRRLQNVQILYIDDFLKLTSNKYNNDSISLAYKILNSRYNDYNKITIISTEYSKTQLEQTDVAIWGRINERTNFGKYWITIKENPSRNYRNNSDEEI